MNRMHHIGFTPRPASREVIEDLGYEIARLPDDLRLVLNLFYFEQLRLDQIAEVLQEIPDDVAAKFYWAHVYIGAYPTTPAIQCAA